MHTTLTDANITQSILDAFAAGNGTLVRKAVGREVYRLDLSAEQSFYVKSFDLTGNIIRKTVVLCKAWHEYYHHTNLLKKNVALPETIGWARIRLLDGKEVVVLVTRTVDNAQPLQVIDDIWHNEKLRNNLFTKLAGFLAKNYRNGVFHKDLHFGNILWDKPNDRLLFVDPKDISACKCLSLNKIMTNLSLLYCSFYPNEKFCESMWRQFLDKFFAQYGLSHPFDKYFELMERFQKRTMAEWIRKRTKRCFRNNVDFLTFRDGAMSGVLARNSSSFFDIIKSNSQKWLDEQFSAPNAEFLKNSNTTAVLRVTESGNHLIIKKFKVKRWFDPLKNLFRHSRAYRSWYWGWRLTLHKRETPRPVFYAQIRRKGLLYENYYAMQCMDQAQTMMDFFNNSGAELSLLERRGVVYMLAGLCRALIDERIHHHDFQLKNLLIEPVIGDKGKREFRLSVIDLEAITSQRCSREAMKWSYLRQLRKSYLRLDNTEYFSAKEIIRFIRLVLDDTFDKDKVDKFLRYKS